MSRFEGTDSYVATQDLMMAVNAAITLERPLLIKGEPGTGKTMLALEVAKALKRPLYEWHIKSTTKAQHGLYEYDAVSRLRDSQLGDPKVHDIKNYIVRGMLWNAFESDAHSVLLIDEVDKADIEFPNDLLRELDRMEFYVYETQQLVKARHRPLVIITSNNEKELPDAFLRRCFFHYIRFPDKETMEKIVRVHFPGAEEVAAEGSAGSIFRNSRCAGAQEETLDVRAARLAEAAAGRRHSARSAAQPGNAQDHPAAARGALEERAGCAFIRAAGVHVAPQARLIPATVGVLPNE
jgi:MoxR-like ATPase